MFAFERIPYLIAFPEKAAFKETYGGSTDTVVLEGQWLKPHGVAPKTALLFMHPISALAFLPMPAALAAQGFHVLCCGSRYRGVDSALIMEKCVLDIGAAVRDARERLGFENVILAGWSGGGSLSLFYQAQAENPTLTHTPAGDVCDLTVAQLIPAQGIMLLAAHISRAHTLTEWMDASILDEIRPDEKDPAFDLYDPQNPHQPPYTEAFVEKYRAAQIARNRRITAWVQQKLEDLHKQGKPYGEWAFVTHGTMADPRWLDPTLDPNDRQPGWCYLGDPRLVNNGPVGLARFNTLRSWLSQWSYDLSNADGQQAAQKIHIPALVIGNSADDACTPSHTQRLFEAIGHTDKLRKDIQGANHYYLGKNQKPMLMEAAQTCAAWMAAHGWAGG